MKRKAKGSRFCAQHTRIIYGWNPNEETKREMKAGAALLECDCQNPDGKGVRHVSMECPVHNDNPWPSQN